jgi:hypothetical protein
MAKHLRLPGSVESKAAAQSYVDVAASYMDVDGGGTFAQFGAKGPGSLGVKIRTILAGVALTVMTFASAGAATHHYNVTMDSGTTLAAQALTSTTFTASGVITSSSYLKLGAPFSVASVAAGEAVIAANKFFRYSHPSAGATYKAFGLSTSSLNFEVGDVAWNTSIIGASILVNGAVSGITTLASGAITSTGNALTLNPGSGASYTSYQLASTEHWRAGNSVVAANNHYVIYSVVNSHRIMDVTAGASPDVAWPNVSTMTFNGLMTMSGLNNITQSGGTASLQAITGTTLVLTTTAVIGPTDPGGSEVLRATSARFGGTATATNMGIASTGSSIAFNMVGVGNVALWASTGVTLNYATIVNGALTVNSNIISAISTAGPILTATVASTGSRYVEIQTTGASAYFGSDNNAGTSFGTGRAYSTIWGSNNATTAEIITVGQSRFGIVGAAGTPANSSVGNIFVINGTAPTGNPTGMYYLWAESGAFKGRGTSGTVTTIGAADPHCPECGRDFVVEWSNAKWGELRVCMWCLTHEHEGKPFVDRTVVKGHEKHLAKHRRSSWAA